MDDEIFEFEIPGDGKTPPPSPRTVEEQRMMLLLGSENREEERSFRSALRQSVEQALRKSTSHTSLTSSEESLSVLQSPGNAYSPLAGMPDLEPLIIGISGGTASGKTSVCKAINDQLRDQRVALITLDSYYRPLTGAEKEQVAQGAFNFDHPDAFDWELVRQQLGRILQREPIEVPVYDYVNNERFAGQSVQISGVDVVFFEGILAFWDPIVRSMLSLKIFVECDADIRLARRVVRDIAERGRTLDHILDQYERTVKPSFDKYTQPTKVFADVIIPRGAANKVAIKLLADHFQQKLLLNSVSQKKAGIRKASSGRVPERNRHAVASAQILESPR